MSWYAKSGDANFNQFSNQQPNVKSVFKFNVKNGESKKIVFLADERFTVFEVTLKIGGSYQTFTSSMGPECPLFQAMSMGKLRLTKTMYHSVLDLTPYTGKDGKERKYSKKAFAVRGEDSIAKIERRRQDAGGNLTGYMMECHRNGEKSPGCGSDFTLKDKVDLSKIPPDDQKPMDFADLLKPAHPSVVKAALDMSAQAGPDTFSRGSDPFGSSASSHPFAPGNYAADVAPPATEAPTTDDLPF